MATLFLIIIYMAFISLGLPDSLLGVAWPLMRLEFGKELEVAGLVSVVLSGGTILSSLASGFVLKRFGTGKVTFVSCLMTAGALLGFSLAPSFIWIIISAIPLSLGAGSIDAGLNNYVATHYKAHHMSWLHCFWGIGATLGPIIMSYFIKTQNTWRSGYQSIFAIQIVLAFLLFVTLPLWNRSPDRMNMNAEKNNEGEEHDAAVEQKTGDKVKPFHIRGVKLAFLSFLFYCGAEATMGLWGSSFLINTKGLPAAMAAQWVSVYYAGITVGRFVTGFITMKVGNPMLIRMGQLIAFVGAVFIMLPLPAVFTLVGFILIGLGCAPIFPCMLHETPVRFGKEDSQTIIGFQMASAYIGSTFLPPLLGWIASRITIKIFPYFVGAYIIAMLLCSEKISLLMRSKNKIKFE